MFTLFSMNLWNQPVSKATDIWYTWDIWPGCFCFGTASHILEEISKFIRVWIQLIIKRSSSQMFTTVFRIQLLIMWSKNLVQSLWRFDHFSGSYEVAKFWNRRKWRHHRASQYFLFCMFLLNLNNTNDNPKRFILLLT